MKRKIFLTTGIIAASATALLADDTISKGEFTAHNVWMMVCAAFVFLMHLGFAAVESGFSQAKNTVNILFKNSAIIAIGILTYTICGFNLMYPGANEGGIIPPFGLDNFGIAPPADGSGMTVAYASGGYTYWTDFLFQAMFAATAATIVSGAVAERVKLGSFLIFSTIFVGICYPITGYWKWGAGFLDAAGFYDFAGSTLVHGVGGWGALACAMILGPRLGKYNEKGEIKPILGHNMPLAALGVFLLWFGWFGFNGGSVLSADPELTSLTLVTTCIAAAAGIVAAITTTWFLFKMPDLGMALNGALAGLVGITAGADQMSPMDATIIGLVAGVIVVFSVRFFDKIKIDDPVGAISVHLVCGIWGTLAVAIFSDAATMGAQIKGIVAVGAFSFIAAFIIFYILKITIGVRVSEKEEIEGLDLSEHGAHAYPHFSKTSGL